MCVPGTNGLWRNALSKCLGTEGERLLMFFQTSSWIIKHYSNVAFTFPEAFFFLWGINHSLAMSPFYKWEDQGLKSYWTSLMPWVKVQQTLHYIFLLPRPLVLATYLSAKTFCLKFAWDSWHQLLKQIFMLFSDISHCRLWFHWNERFLAQLQTYHLWNEWLGSHCGAREPMGTLYGNTHLICIKCLLCTQHC